MRVTSSNTTQAKLAAAQEAACRAEQWAGVTAYARPNGTFVTITDLGPDCHNDGKWAYEARLNSVVEGDEHNPVVTFNSKTPLSGKGLKLKAGHALNSY